MISTEVAVAPVERTYEVQGVAATVREEGTGPPVLFVHDWLETSVSFTAIAKALGPRCRRLLFDLPGFGSTPTPEGWNFSLDAYAGFLQAVIHQSALREATLVLHGFGLLVGLRAVEAKGSEAERRVSRLVLLNGPLYDQGPKGLGVLRRRGPFEELSRLPPYDLPGYRRAMLARWGDPTYFDEEVVQALFRSWRPRGVQTLRALSHQSTKFKEALPRLREGLARWDGELQVLWGEDDPMLASEVGQRLSADLPRAEVLLFPDVGHQPHLEAPDAIAAELRKVLAERPAKASPETAKAAAPGPAHPAPRTTKEEGHAAATVSAPSEERAAAPSPPAVETPSPAPPTEAAAAPPVSEEEAAMAALTDLYAKEHDTLLEDPRRLRGLLAEVCPGARRPVNVLVAALEDGIPQALQGSSTKPPVRALTQKLEEQLVADRGLSPEVARWAVRAWGRAVGVIPASPANERRARRS